MEYHPFYSVDLEYYNNYCVDDSSTLKSKK